jgi:Domain of unknown function (DUF1905)/Bacteriocin-protection, YdeI or OmpD-Associated
MTAEQPIINQQFLIQKMPMKGGWSFVEFPNIPKQLKQPFGWVPVKGTIDGYEIKQFKLWTMASGNMFMPIKAEIRKKIKKGEGDWVHITLYYDDSPLVVPEEFLVCLLDSPKAYEIFQSMRETSQKHYIDWIYESKSMETRVNRIAKAIEKLEKGLKLYQSLDEDI